MSAPDPCPPTYPRGGDPRRRAVLRERLYLRRRNAKAFDQWADRLYGVDSGELSGNQDEPNGDTGDWWLDIGMTLTVEEREQSGSGA